MTPIPVWTQQSSVFPYDTDFQGFWKPAACFQLFQDAATNHAANLGFGYHAMLAEGQVWVLSRLKVYFYRFPVLGEMLTVRTWPKGIRQKIFFTRDFQITTSDGELYAAATSAWLLINTNTRRMVLPGSLSGTLPDNTGLNALDEDLLRLMQKDGCQERFTAQANYSAVDLVGHVNNARYIDWVLDCFAFEHFKKYRLAWLQINFNNEVRAGESVRVGACTLDGDPAHWLVVGEKSANGEKAFEAEIGWVDR